MIITHQISSHRLNLFQNVMNKVTMLQAGQSMCRGSISGNGKNCSSRRRDWFPDPPCLLYNRYCGISSPRRRAATARSLPHDPPPAKIKNKWSHTSIPPYAFTKCTWTTLSFNTDMQLPGVTISTVVRKGSKRFPIR
jgi:hypothetical protein